MSTNTQLPLTPLILTDHPDMTTLQNLQLNNFYGEPYKNQKPPNTFRLHAWNPNGIKIDRLENVYVEYLRSMATIEADCIALYEINLDTQQHKIRKTLHETTKTHFEHHRLTFGSSAIPSTHSFKPGGTLLLLQGNTTRRVTSKGTDDLGRWCYQTLVGRE